ncbi:MAG: DUF2333 family protein [Pseudomonadota bacterium]
MSMTMDGAPASTGSGAEKTSPKAEKAGIGVGGIIRRTVLGSLVGVNLVGAYVLGGMLLTERIDNDTNFQPPVVTEGGLASVDITVALIEREVDEYAWVSNEPFFMPGHWLPNMRHYQQGVVYGVSRFAMELADSLGRSRSATAVDPDLDSAAGLLRFPGDVWIFDFEQTWTPVVTSEEQYMSAVRKLQAYNARIASGQAIFDPRRDNLLTTLTRIEADVSSKINILSDHVEGVAAGRDVETQTNEVFYLMKGRLYAYTMLLKALEKDFASVIEAEGLTLTWDNMIASFENAASLKPFIVTNSAPGSVFIPNHVSEIGFFALRAKTQLRDVMTVLSQ